MKGTLRHERSAPEDYVLVHDRKNWNPWAWIKVVGGPKDVFCENCGEPKANHVSNDFCAGQPMTDEGIIGKPMKWKPMTAALSVKVKRTDEGVVVDIFRKEHEDEDPIATTYAYFSE